MKIESYEENQFEFPADSKSRKDGCCPENGDKKILSRVTSFFPGESSKLHIMHVLLLVYSVENDDEPT